MALLGERELRGKDLLAILETEGDVKQDSLWWALVDLQDAGLITDEGHWFRERLDYRMSTLYRITEAGSNALGAARRTA